MKVDQTNILHKVHKNVKYMLSEIRQIIKEKHILSHISKKGSQVVTTIRSNRQSSLFPSQNFKRQSNLLDRYKQIRSKQKPYMSTHESPTRNSIDKPKQTYRFRQRQKHKQSHPYINSEEKSERSINRNYIQKLRLPTIQNGRQKKKPYNSQNYCLTLAIDETQRKKSKKTLKSSNLPTKSRLNSQIIRPGFDKLGECLSGQNIKAFTYSPWQNREQESEALF